MAGIFMASSSTEKSAPSRFGLWVWAVTVNEFTEGTISETKSKTAINAKNNR